MRNISERDLSVFISLLASKIAEMTRELRELEAAGQGNLNAEQLNDQYELQECIEQYDNILGGVREEYEAGLIDGINLPSYEELTKAINS
jgi:hypothetical protein